MKVVRASEFASVMGIAERLAREAFRQGAMGTDHCSVRSSVSQT